MFDDHLVLSARFKALSETRPDDVVYFLEHGLDPQELDELRVQVREVVTTSRPEAPVWGVHPLPLLVIATEVGYQYRGNGTDFWPSFDAELGGGGLTERDCDAVAKLFETESRRLCGVTPPNNRWSECFRRIAWPITHAILPIELNRHFAAALARVSGSVRDASDDAVLDSIVRAGVGRGSNRFDSWLENERLVVHLTRAFLGDQEAGGFIEERALERIIADLRADPRAQRDIEIAQTRQERAREIEARAPRPRAVRQAEDIVGSLSMRHDGARLALLGTLPVRGNATIQGARLALRRRRFTPRLWGASKPLTSEALLCGLPFEITVDALEATTGASLLDVDGPGVAADVKRELARLKLDVDASCPVVFKERAFAENDRLREARQLRGGVATTSGRYWILMHATATLDAALRAGADVEKLGEIAGRTCVCVVASDPQGKALLEAAGVIVKDRVSLRWTGSPSLAPGAQIASHLIDDFVVLNAAAVPRDGVHVVGTGAAGDVLEEGLFPVLGMRGMTRVEIGENRRPGPSVHFTRDASETAELCSIWLEGGEHSLRALLAGELSIRVEGAAPMSELPLSVELAWGERSVAVYETLGPLPAIVGPASDLWDALVCDDIREVLASRDDVALSVSVGGLAHRQWRLERPLFSQWWVGQGAEVTLMSEDGPADFGVVLASKPLEDPSREIETARDGVRLFAPLAREGAPEAQFAGRCVAVTGGSLVAAALPERFLRRRVDHDGAVGVERLATAYLRWSLADGTSVLAEIRRRQVAARLDKWFAGVVCGERWAAAERDASVVPPEPHEIFLDVCKQEGIGFYEPIVLEGLEVGELRALLGLQLRGLLDDVWGRALPDDAAVPPLDDAFVEAYETLAARARHRGDYDRAHALQEADPFSEPAEWLRVLRLSKRVLERHELAALITPTDAAPALATLDYGAMGTNELVDEVRGWVRRHLGTRGRAWSEEDVSAAVLLWVEPGSAIRRPWRASLDRMLADRAVSRALRYVALRRRTALANPNHGADQ